MFRLCHISDPHLGPLPPVVWHELVSKRITGYINWQQHRGKVMGSPVLGELMADLSQQSPDHLAITGDLVNLGLAAEIANARAWLETLGDPKSLSIVPGNHDAYVPGSLARACREWSAFMTGDEPSAASSPDTAFPYMRIRKNVALIGVSSAIPTSPFLARGEFRPPQADRLGALLKSCGQQGLFRIIMIHHPPVRGATALHKRLFGIGLFQRVVKAHGAELILHGHTHKPTLHHIEGRQGKVPVVGVSATSQAPNGRRPASGYNLFEISGEKAKWNCVLVRKQVMELGAITHESAPLTLFLDGKSLSPD